MSWLGESDPTAPSCPLPVPLWCPSWPRHQMSFFLFCWQEEENGNRAGERWHRAGAVGVRGLLGVGAGALAGSWSAVPAGRWPWCWRHSPRWRQAVGQHRDSLGTRGEARGCGAPSGGSPCRGGCPKAGEPGGGQHPHPWRTAGLSSGVWGQGRGLAPLGADGDGRECEGVRTHRGAGGLTRHRGAGRVGVLRPSAGCSWGPGGHRPRCRGSPGNSASRISTGSPPPFPCQHQPQPQPHARQGGDVTAAAVVPRRSCGCFGDKGSSGPPRGVSPTQDLCFSGQECA